MASRYDLLQFFKIIWVQDETLLSASFDLRKYHEVFGNEDDIIPPSVVIHLVRVYVRPQDGAIGGHEMKTTVELPILSELLSEQDTYPMVAGEGILAALVDVVMIGTCLDALLYGVDIGTDIVAHFEYLYDSSLSFQVFDDILQHSHYMEIVVKSIYTISLM